MDGSAQGGAAEGAIRLQLAIARAGLASRRHAEEMIAAGRVRVNGAVVTEMGVKVVPGSDDILVDGRPLPAAPSRTVAVMLNKPAGYVCAVSDGHGAKLVTELVADAGERLLPAGRLDKDSRGLLVLSNDGALIEKITHPRHGHTKVYVVEVSGLCDDAALEALRRPMTIDGYTTRPARVECIGRAGRHTRLRFSIGEGRNRQVRKMCALAGLNVVSLTRVAIDGLQLGNLPVGAWRELTKEEVAALAGEGAGPVTSSPSRPRREDSGRSRTWRHGRGGRGWGPSCPPGGESPAGPARV